MKKIGVLIVVFVVSTHALYAFNHPINNPNYYEQSLAQSIFNPITQAILDDSGLVELQGLITRHSEYINTTDCWLAFSWEGNDFFGVCTPLYAAMLTCNPQAVALLLAAGTNPNLVMYSGDRCFLHLYNKIIRGRSSGTLVQNFIELCCDSQFLMQMVEQKPDFHTLEFELFQIFEMLMRYGADLNPVNSYPGNSPLQSAFFGAVASAHKQISNHASSEENMLPLLCFHLNLVQRLFQNGASHNVITGSELPWSQFRTVYVQVAHKLGAMHPARLKLISSWICAVLQKLPK